VLVAIAVNEDGYRKVLGVAECMNEDKESWTEFLKWLKSRGLSVVRLVIEDHRLDMVESVAEVFPEAHYQRCVVHFYRNIFTATPRTRIKLISQMLKVIHAQESKEAAREKAKQVVAALREMKLNEAAEKLESGIKETLSYMDFPFEHWTRILTTNLLERMNREIRR
jgi:putative transposase